MNRLDRQIQRTQEKVRELKRQQLEAKKLEREKREAKKRGRKPISEDLLKEIENFAYENPLPYTAFKFGVCLRTLYNYGITREALDEKTSV